jgi:sugar/nucleoside kinase (ribokinase family)
MPTRPPGIVAAGLWLIDSTKYIDRFPEPARLATVSEVVVSNGGGAFNVLIDLAKLGASFPLTAIGRIGDDAGADWILQRCRVHGINTRQLRRTPETKTAATDVMTEAGSGRRTFFYMPGANTRFRAEDVSWDQCHGRIFYLGYPGLLPQLDPTGEGNYGLRAILAEASRAGFTTAVDCVSTDSSHWSAYADVLPDIDFLFVNEWEACRLLQAPVPDEEIITADLLEKSGRALIGRGVRNSVVVHAAAGAVCVTKNGPALRLGAVRVPENDVRGTCGAGDALASGFLFGLHEGRCLEDCLRLGICAAATCLHHLTSSDGIRTAEECLAYGQQLGHRSF